MYHSADLNILFATNFSDSCFRAARTIAQLADPCRVNLTIAHVAKPSSQMSQTRSDLNSFFAEADSYDSCQRVLVESDNPIRAIGSLCENDQFDFVVAPGSIRSGWNSLFAPSFRAGLLKECRFPLLTAGTCLYGMSMKPTLRTIACLLDFEAPNQDYLHTAMSLAQRVGAKFRLLCIIPEIHEGTLARSLDSEEPLSVDVALNRISTMFGSQTSPDVTFAVGEANQLVGLLAKCDADLLFVGPGQALRWAWRPTLAGHLDKLPCPVVCVDGAASHFNRWSFERKSVQLSLDPRSMGTVDGSEWKDTEVVPLAAANQFQKVPGSPDTWSPKLSPFLQH